MSITESEEVLSLGPFVVQDSTSLDISLAGSSSSAAATFPSFSSIASSSPPPAGFLGNTQIQGPVNCFVIIPCTSAPAENKFRLHGSLSSLTFC